MFDQVMKRSNWIWIYKMGRFAEERRAFLSDLNEQGHSMHTLRNVNKFLLAIAERVNVRRPTEVAEVQIVRAARDWVAKSCAPNSKTETREAATKRFVYIAKNWLRFLGKWHDPERNPQFRAELDSFLKELRDERGYSDQTLSTRKSGLNVFFEWLGKQGIPLQEVSPQTIAAYFVENKTRGWKKATIKVYAQSLRAFFRYAAQQNWCAPGLAETIERPRIYSQAGLPEGPSWEQVRRLIASLDSDPSAMRTPISRVRCVTAYLSSPYNPARHSNNAAPPKISSRCAASRWLPNESSTTWSIVLKVACARSGFTCPRIERNSGIIESGGRSVRTARSIATVDG